MADRSSLRWRSSLGAPSGGQGVGGAFGSEGLVAGEHVPDRFGKPAGEIDLRDLGAALLADARFRLLVALAIHRSGAEQRHVAVVGAEVAQLAFAIADLSVELVDQAQAGLEGSLPRLGESEAGEQLAAADTEEIGDGAGLAVCE